MPEELAAGRSTPEPMRESGVVLNCMHFEEHYELFTTQDRFNEDYGHFKHTDVQRWLFEWRCW